MNLLGNEAVKVAAKYRQIDVLKYLLNNTEIDPSVNDNSAIKMATGYCFDDVILELSKDPRVDISINNNLLKVACARNKESLVNHLLSDKRVIEKIDKDWMNKNLNKNQIQLIRKGLK